MKKNILLLCLLVTSFYSRAGLHKAPPTFFHNGLRVVWTDFITADHKIIFDVNNQTARSVSEIKFRIRQAGHPLFDSVNTISQIYLDGKEVGEELIQTPNMETKVRRLKVSLPPGTYKMTIYSSIEKGVSFNDDTVSAGFFMKDMRDREFLEKYLPSNLEYDQYKIKLSATIKASNSSHRLFTNGKSLQTRKNHFEVSYPAFFNSSSLYFHLVPTHKFKVKETTFNSIDGRSIPVTIYSKKKYLNKLVKRKVFKILKELEEDYGAWPHPQLILYSNSKLRGGMEYAGAAVSGWFAIGHELQHAYFARAILPKNGNAGWLDEGIASWRDYFHATRSEPNFDSSNIGNHGPYIRKTDLSSYKKGRSFMSYLDHIIQKETQYCLKDFLKYYFNKRKYTTIDTNIFLKDLELFTGLSFEMVFNQYVFGVTQEVENKKATNPYHLNLSEEQVRDLL